MPKIYNGRNKTFFLVSEEWQRIISPLSPAQASVPQASERAGDFSQSGIRLAGVLDNRHRSTVCTAYTNNPEEVNSCTGSGTQVTHPFAARAGCTSRTFSAMFQCRCRLTISRTAWTHTRFCTNFKDTFDNLDSVVRVDQRIGRRRSVFYATCMTRSLSFFPQGQFTTVYIAGANTATWWDPGTQHIAHGTYVVQPHAGVQRRLRVLERQIVSTPAGFLGLGQVAGYRAGAAVYEYGRPRADPRRQRHDPLTAAGRPTQTTAPTTRASAISPRPPHAHAHRRLLVIATTRSLRTTRTGTQGSFGIRD